MGWNDDKIFILGKRAVEIGIVKSRDIKKNRDSDNDRILLQVDMVDGDNDVRTIEVFNQAGENTNPGDNCRVVIDFVDNYKIAIAASDDLEPEVDPGEKEIYSTDSPVTEKKARIKLSTNGDITIDAYGGAKIELDHGGDITINGGTDNAVRYSDLKNVIDELQNDITTLKNAFTSWVVVPTDGGGALKTAAAAWAGTPLSEDISNAKIDDVKVP